MQTRTTGYYQDLETESEQQRERRKMKVARSLVDMAARTSHEFGARMDRAGIDPGGIRTYEDFARIPPIRKKEIIELQAEHGVEWMLSEGIGGLRRIYQSPGPIFDPEGNEQDYWGWAEAFYAAGFRPEDLVQMTFSYHLTPAGLMLEEPLREIGCCVIPAGPGNSQVQLDIMSRLPVTGFVGMASYLNVLGKKAMDKGMDLKEDFALEVAFVAAERLTESLRNEVQENFDMLVRQGYGTADVGCIAYECQELTGMHISSRALVEICDPVTALPVAPGETGEVIVTPFTESYPLIRLATGDLSYLVEGECACGRTSARLGGIVGRVDDTAKVKGQFIYPSQVAKAMAAFEQVQRWQVVVSNPGGRDTLRIKLQTTGPVDEGAMTAALQERIKLRPSLVVLPEGETLAEDAPALVDEREFED